jgi:hypothetical protein
MKVKITRLLKSVLNQTPVIKERKQQMANLLHPILNPKNPKRKQQKANLLHPKYPKRGQQKANPLYPKNPKMIRKIRKIRNPTKNLKFLN